PFTQQGQHSQWVISELCTELAPFLSTHAIPHEALTHQSNHFEADSIKIQSVNAVLKHPFPQAAAGAADPSADGRTSIKKRPTPESWAPCIRITKVSNLRAGSTTGI
ncbi:MAG: hypothetical protein KAG70_09500, partial [Alcanivorax sp.]|nr:hypothetical protein [Alcanivorax sp.]